MRRLTSGSRSLSAVSPGRRRFRDGRTRGGEGIGCAMPGSERGGPQSILRGPAPRQTTFFLPPQLGARARCRRPRALRFRPPASRWELRCVRRVGKRARASSKLRSWGKVFCSDPTVFSPHVAQSRREPMFIADGVTYNTDYFSIPGQYRVSRQARAGTGATPEHKPDPLDFFPGLAPPFRARDSSARLSHDALLLPSPPATRSPLWSPSCSRTAWSSTAWRRWRPTSGRTFPRRPRTCSSCSREGPSSPSTSPAHCASCTRTGRAATSPSPWTTSA